MLKFRYILRFNKMATLIDGKSLSKVFLEKIRQELINFKANNTNFQVGLAIVQVFFKI